MDFLLHIIIIINFWIPVVLGYNLVFGKGKIFHFGPIGAWAATVYAFYITMMTTQSFVLGLGAALLMAIISSLMFAWVALRLEPDGMGVLSIALHLSIMAVILNWTDLTRGALGIPGIPRAPFLQSMEVFALVSTLVSVAWVIVFILVDRSAFGRQVDALSEHEWHAKSLGISRTFVYTGCFLLFGLSTISSSFFSPQYLHLLHPSDYQFPSFIFLVLLVVAGKPGSVRGCLVATVLLVLLREGMRFIPLAPSVLGPMRLMIFGFILFGAVYWRRDTLFPKQRSI